MEISSILLIFIILNHFLHIYTPASHSLMCVCFFSHDLYNQENNEN